MRIRKAVGRKLFALVVSLLASFAGPSGLAHAEFKFEILKSFERPNSDSYAGSDALVRGSDGALYGVAASGGDGMIFKIDASGTLIRLHSFHPAASPHTLLLGSDGAFYGTTSNDIFKIDSGGSYALLHSFHYSYRDAFEYPYPALVEGSDGAYYGSTICEAFRIDSAGNFTSLHSFNDLKDGCNAVYGNSYPLARLTLGSDGSLYGITGYVGGWPGGPTIFKIDSAGNFTSIHSFTDGDAPSYAVPLVAGSDGALYGATQGTPALPATIFKIDSSGTFMSLHSFNGPGERVNAALVLGSDGALYGTADCACPGTIFRIDSAGTFTRLHSLGAGESPTAPLAQGSDGAYYGIYVSGSGEGTIFKVDGAGTFISFPLSLAFYGHRAPLTLGGDGALYGTTEYGGSAGLGTIYKIDSFGEFTSLHSFSSPEGYEPRVGLWSDGAFYGTTAGGASGGGTIFKIDERGTFTSLHAFDSAGTFNSVVGPSLVKGTDGAVYGITTGGVPKPSSPSADGTVFRVDQGGTFSSVHSFSGPDGSRPNGLILGSDGALYGATTSGGSANFGTIFKVDKLGEFSSLHSFDGALVGTGPTLRLRGSDGSLYGLTGWCAVGTVFRVDTPVIFVPLHDWSLPSTATEGCGVSSLVQGSDGALYAADYYGTVFKIDSSGELSTLASVGAGIFYLDLVFGSDGVLYGSDRQRIFKIDAAGNITTRYSLDPPSVNGISGFRVESDGTLYGQTFEGWLFKVDPGGSVTSLHSFTGEDGFYPSPELVHGADCALYGTAVGGGPGGGGVVYRLYEPGQLCQHIGFNPLPDQTLGAPPFTVYATSPSGLPVSLSARGSCSVEGDEVTLTGGGLCTLTASQAGDANYQPAPEVSQSFNVLFAFNGFLRPVLDPPAVNRVRAGQTVPIRFTLGADAGREVFAEGSPSVQQVPCDANAPANNVWGAITGRSSLLLHAPKSDRYTYLWKTDKHWAGTCQEFSLKLIDGTEHKASFSFRIPRRFGWVDGSH